MNFLIDDNFLSFCSVDSFFLLEEIEREREREREREKEREGETEREREREREKEREKCFQLRFYLDKFLSRKLII